MLRHKQTHGGKGDACRISDKDKFNANFDRIFGKVSKQEACQLNDENENKKPVVPKAWLHT